ncbi:MAG: ribonuclease III [Alphaproteobacteria bacterium]|nr:ribonuclease III [Alphaproteobacteria bacterium]MBE8221051.1 ribonuclease III [Alphaproteobacteria bacterium]
MNRNLKAFAKRLGYEFKQQALLERALLHDSAATSKAKDKESNEHLEFLGDRVLGLVIAETLVAKFTHESEGHLARRLATLVSRDTCAVIAAAWGLDKVIVTDKTTRPLARNIMADGCEAILGAIYLDGGIKAAQSVIHTHWHDIMRAQIIAPQDAKTALQEYTMKRKLELPLYEIIEKQGPDHAPHFIVSVMVAQQQAQGQGASVRVAQSQAAQAWLTQYKSADND